MQSWDSPYMFIVDMWWRGMVFHMILHYSFWLTRAGHWTNIWGGHTK